MVGSRAEPPEIGVLGNKLLSDEHAFYTLLVTMVGRQLWGPGCGAPRSPGVGNKYWSCFYTLFGDTGRGIGVGSRGGAPGSSGVSDEHDFIP